MVEKGDTSKALISWYFVLAHELAVSFVFQRPVLPQGLIIIYKA
jgi:hypothetical protein